VREAVVLHARVSRQSRFIPCPKSLDVEWCQCRLVLRPKNWPVQYVRILPIRKTSQFSAEQIIKILDQAEKGEQTVGTVCREHGITETTFYRWRRAYGGMAVNEAQRLKELEKENARLKRLLAERVLELDLLKELLQKKG